MAPTRRTHSVTRPPACVASDHGVHDTAHDRLVPCNADAFPEDCGLVEPQRATGATRAWRQTLRVRATGQPQHRVWEMPPQPPSARRFPLLSRHLPPDRWDSLVRQHQVPRYTDGGDRRVGGCPACSLDLSMGKRRGPGRACSWEERHQALLTCKPATISDGGFISHSKDAYLLVKRQTLRSPTPAPSARPDTRRAPLPRHRGNQA
jgi:hypothetical protein